jgi:3-deoxy-D-manno-octulosonate 8-phosphate phosphatase (KDO 8-P phosphatase)
LAKKKIRLENLDAIIFDFDGVLTDNRVYLDQAGRESVRCNRGDGLAFEVLRELGKPAYILSTEKNPVVSKRARKLKVPVLQGINNKAEALSGLAVKKGYKIRNILYVGNDLNDYHAMKMCGYSACPADSHMRIKKVATITLKTLGGAGVARELLENVMRLDFVEILFPTQK